jgi:hypothetical protein
LSFISNWLRRTRLFGVRNVDGGLFLERFLVSGVATLLLLRFYLEITGYPQIGGGGLHIAHLLWGGLLMLVAIVLSLAFLGEALRGAVSVLGGIGFGLFIDELGKFITSDNNYFFRPTIALIYVVFVILFMVFRVIDHARPHSEEGYLVNALKLTSEAILRGYDREDHDRALEMLARVPASNPIAVALREALSRVSVTPDAAPSRLIVCSRWVRERYRRMVQASWFSKLVMGGFLAYAVLSILALALVLAATVHEPLRRAGLAVKGELSFSTLTDLLIVAGAVLWYRSRLHGHMVFRLAILVSILLAQPFLFYTDQLAAFIWLCVDLVLLETLNYMIDDERRTSHSVSRPSPPIPA